jgi:antitoxin FitA
MTSSGTPTCTSLHGASMAGMATLYVRNIPGDLYERLQRWAAERDHSVNAEVIDLLHAEADRRAQDAEFARRFDEYRQKYCGKQVAGPPWASDLIREDRDRGHKPEFGY